MLPISDYISSLGSQFQSVPPEKVSVLTEVFSSTTSRKAFSDNYNYAVALQVLHVLALEKINAESGNISRKKTGDIEIAYGPVTGKGANKYYEMTTFGQQYSILKKKLFFGGINRTM